MFMQRWDVLTNGDSLIELTHRGQVMHIYVSVNRVNFGSCNGLSPSLRQTIMYESMLTYFQLDTQEQTQILINFMSKKICWKSVQKLAIIILMLKVLLS